MKSRIFLSLMLILLAITPVSIPNANALQSSDFLTLTVNPEEIPSPGMSTDISVSLDQTCSEAVYILMVIPPGAKDVIDDINQDLKDADLNIFNFKSQMKQILEEYQGETTIWYRVGSLNSGETDTHDFPNDDWKKLLGDDEANTLTMGKYKVFLIGLCKNSGGRCCLCCVKLDFACSRFFVVPESIIGTVGPIAASLLSLGLLKLKKRE